MHVLTVYAHPNPKSFCLILQTTIFDKRAYDAGLREAMRMVIDEFTLTYPRIRNVHHEYFYAVAALNTDAGYLGSDGYLLGDRIAPQTTVVSRNPRHKNVIVVHYGDRRSDEPMTAPPSAGKSLYLKLDAENVRWGIVAPGFEGESR